LRGCFRGHPGRAGFCNLGHFSDHALLDRDSRQPRRIDPRAPIHPIDIPICRKSNKINVLNKFSFDPSQEDEGQKKTVHWMGNSGLWPHHV